MKSWQAKDEMHKGQDLLAHAGEPCPSAPPRTLGLQAAPPDAAADYPILAVVREPVVSALLGHWGERMRV